MALAGCCDLTRQAREYIDTVSETNRSFPTFRRHKPTLRTGGVQALPHRQEKLVVTIYETLFVPVAYKRTGL